MTNQRMFSEDELHEAQAPVHLPAKTEPRPLTNAAAATDESRAIAQVQAAMLIAQRFPRDEVKALDNVLMAFTRPALAEASLFDYARGGTDITGLTIRAAEAIAQRWGHIHMGVEELDQRDGMSTVRAFAFDAQTGTADSRVFQVKHWRETKRGGYAIEDSRDVYELVANLAARRKRACILTVIPFDVQDAVKDQIARTMKANAELNLTPDGIAAMLEGFAKFGVTTAQIEARIQRRIDAITPAAFVSLRKVYNSLRDGMSNIGDWFPIESGERAEGSAAGKADAVVDRGTAGLRARAERAKHQATENTAGQNAVVKEAAAAKDETSATKFPTGVTPEAPTYAEVMHAINTAKTSDEMDVAADLMRSLPDPAHRAECDIALRKARAERKL